MAVEDTNMTHGTIEMVDGHMQFVTTGGARVGYRYNGDDTVYFDQLAKQDDLLYLMYQLGMSNRGEFET